MFASAPAHMRRVYILAIAAVVLTLIAIAGSILTRVPAAQAFKPEAYFPNFSARAPDTRRIIIKDKDHETQLNFAPETGWVATEKDGYRASYDKIQGLVLGLASLERYEKKTKDPKWQAKLLLTDPREKGEGQLVQLLDEKGKPIAEILLGLSADVDAASGKAQLYARTPGDDQVWLVRGAGISPLSADSADWVDRLIIDVPKKRIARAEIAVADAAPYAISRVTAEAENFSVEALPKGMALKSETSANGVGTVLSQLTMRDVASADRLTFSPASTSATYETFNGLKIRVETSKLGPDTWIRLMPSVMSGADEQAKAEAVDLARRLSPWVYQIESWKSAQLETPLNSIIGPENAKANMTPSALPMEDLHSGAQTPPKSFSSDSEMGTAPKQNSQKPGAHGDNSNANRKAPPAKDEGDAMPAKPKP